MHRVAKMIVGGITIAAAGAMAVREVRRSHDDRYAAGYANGYADGVNAWPRRRD